MKIGSGRTKAYRIASILILIVLALLFLFPLYWIVTGSFKSAQDIYAAEPKLFPTEWVTTNFEKLFAKRSAPLWELHRISYSKAYVIFIENNTLRCSICRKLK